MGDCPCNTDLIMAEVKTKKTSKLAGIEASLQDALSKMVQEADASTGDDKKDAARRQCIAKLDAAIKFIEARWN